VEGAEHQQRRPEIIRERGREGRELMNKIKHHHPQHGGESDDVHHGFHRPYWKHAHHDWRLVVAVLLMLVAVIVYVMSDDLAWRPRGKPRQPLSGAAGK
jgi:hypothetical protein